MPLSTFTTFKMLQGLLKNKIISLKQSIEECRRELVDDSHKGQLLKSEKLNVEHKKMSRVRS